ncbi:MerR family transcriptional regulator [Schleiferilactobacillus perolens]|jgi:DNA-binding transcriptional MerR regulator|uniref:MerR family transcriptional regulator n=1 Tax=Schleiferilactobacillus perolens TaxID=100468 RepID=UPI002355DFF2|nr:MerR family transcriptional regulator [Schleiferilactobacillus perolens]MCI2171005.1 MerR family transcriptional regulator [Schleiferilactobacillus perolens]
MAYTIQQLAALAGVSTRTLRYYDTIGLLPAQRNSANDYREYTTVQVDRLQRILFLRLFGMPLATIQKILDAPLATQQAALLDQRQRILAERDRLDHLLTTLDKTLKRGGNHMSDTEKFAAFKEKQIKENDAQFGSEIREKYGEEKVSAANKQYAGLSEADYNAMQDTESKMLTLLKAVIQSGQIDSPEAQQVFSLHKAWLQFTWPTYSAEAHKGLAQMYTADPRFGQYYAAKTGSDKAASVLAAIIEKYAV